jgi:carboxylesterase type B
VIWRNGIETLTAEQITACFDKARNAAELKEAYGIVPTRSTAAKLGALDFLNDVWFAMPANDIAAKWREAKKRVFQYVVDQPNPWQPSSRAHHAVDLIHLFGGYDIAKLNPAAEAVGEQMRGRWIAFVNGEGPWSSDKRYAFGPLGECGEIGEGGYKARRRVGHFEMLKKSDQGEIVKIFMGLAAGRLGLDN